MPAPTFSIAIPIRSHVELLQTALRSIEAQRTGMEIAVLDATEDDRAQQILTAHRVPVAYGYHRPDSGQAAAIQEGWDRTRGDVVAWLNADDYYFPDALDRVAAVFEAQPETDVVYGHAVHVSAEGHFLSYFPAIDPDPASLARGCTISQPSCFIRRRAMERVGGLNTGLHYTMDWDLWLRLHRAGSRFAFLDAPLSAVRLHPATKTMSRSADRYREIAALLTAGGARALQRLATLLSFYEYDLQNRRTRLSDRIVYGLMSRASRMARRVRQRPPRMVQGIECWTNLVRGECRVDVPRYGDAAMVDIAVVSDRPIALRFASGSVTGMLDADGTTRTVFGGVEMRGHRYSGRVPTRDRTLSVDLNAGPSTTWRLLRVNVG